MNLKIICEPIKCERHRRVPKFFVAISEFETGVYIRRIGWWMAKVTDLNGDCWRDSCRRFMFPVCRSEYPFLKCRLIKNIWLLQPEPFKAFRGRWIVRAVQIINPQSLGLPICWTLVGFKSDSYMRRHRISNETAT